MTPKEPPTVESQDPSRAAPRRAHRVRALYLVMHAWVKRLDCVILGGEDLRLYLGGIARLESGRITNIVKDVESLFPFHHVLPGSSGSPTLFLSRVPMPHEIWATPGLLYEFKERLVQNGIRAGFVELPAEDAIVALNAQVIHGDAHFAPLTDNADDDEDE
jgi:hypothetical protein